MLHFVENKFFIEEIEAEERNQVQLNLSFFELTYYHQDNFVSLLSVFKIKYEENYLNKLTVTKIRLTQVQESIIASQ